VTVEAMSKIVARSSSSGIHSMIVRLFLRDPEESIDEENKLRAFRRAIG
jgi:hypothetical protein